MRKVCAMREVTRRRSALTSEDTHTHKCRGSVRRFAELEGKLYLWLDSMRRAKCPFHLHAPFLKQTKLLSNYQYHRTILKYHGWGLTDLKNAEDWNNFLFTTSGQRQTEKTLIVLDDVSENLETYGWRRLCT